MDFTNCTNGPRNHFVQYTTGTTGVDIDRAICVDLNLDGFDEVVITRTESSSLIVLPNITGE